MHWALGLVTAASNGAALFLSRTPVDRGDAGY